MNLRFFHIFREDNIDAEMLANIGLASH